MATFDEPQSRIEAILQNMLGANNTLLPPMSRNEALLLQLLQQGDATQEEIADLRADLIPKPSIEDGEYTLRAVVKDGVLTYEWIKEHEEALVGQAIIGRAKVS